MLATIARTVRYFAPIEWVTLALMVATAYFIAVPR